MACRQRDPGGCMPPRPLPQRRVPGASPPKRCNCRCPARAREMCRACRCRQSDPVRGVLPRALSKRRALSVSPPKCRDRRRGHAPSRPHLTLHPFDRALRRRSRCALNPSCARRMRRLSAVARGGTAGAPQAPWMRRVVALQAILHQVRHQSAQRKVRVLVRKQHLKLLQPMPALRADRRLQLPAPVAERAHPVARLRQFRVDLRQHLLHFTRALARRLLDQLLPRRGIQHRPAARCRAALAAAHRCRRRRVPWCTVIPRRPARAATRPVTARRVAMVAVAALEQVLQLRRVAQGQRTVAQQLAGNADLGAQPHRLDAPPRGGRGVAQFAQGVVEQAKTSVFRTVLHGVVK